MSLSLHCELDPRTVYLVVDTLATFIGAYVDGRSDVTERRRDKLRLAKRRLIAE